MLINNQPYEAIWREEKRIFTIDQRLLPWEFQIIELRAWKDALEAIQEMKVRGAPLIGVTAAYGMYLALLKEGTGMNLKEFVLDIGQQLKSARPTAVNLAYAVDRITHALLSRIEREDPGSGKDGFETAEKLAFREAENIRREELEYSQRMGKHGLALIEEAYNQKQDTVQILTHCNAGWLATVDYGTATAPVYRAHEIGIPVHVWVDETRPRNQGSLLTAWELYQQGIPHTVIPDNTGGHLMQRGMVDMVLVGSDRVSLNGDVANKIGTYLKALAAFDNKIPFYAVLPTSTIDTGIEDGLRDIPIEERSQDEVKYLKTRYQGKSIEALTLNPDSPALNYGFDVTPARLVTALITEKGMCRPSREEILTLKREQALR